MTKNFYLPTRKLLVACLAMVAGVTFLSGCKKGFYYKDPYIKVKPTGPKPSWGPTIQPQMLSVIEVFDSIAPMPVYQLTPVAARMQKTPADAVMRVMQKFRIPTAIPKVDTTGKNIPVDGGTIHLRIYTPKTSTSSYPAIVYYHGGGWVIATIDTYNASAQALAEKTGAVVIAVEYRKGPEYKFPTAHNDAFAAYQWVLSNAASIKIDPKKIAVAGESAGGNMAITVSMMARDKGIPKPIYQLSVYPVASKDLTLPSKIVYKDAHPLSTPALPWFLGHYLNSPADASSPLINLNEANLSGLPNTTIIAAEIDPLQSEGTILAAKLTAAGNKVHYKLYPGVTHEFFGMAAVVPEAKDAQDLAASMLKKAFQ